MKHLVLLSIASALTLFALPVSAQTVDEAYPWYDLEHRLTIGATLRHQWFAASGDEFAPQTPKEFVAGPVFAYELTQHLTLVANVLYGFDSKHIATQIGLSVPIYGRD